MKGRLIPKITTQWLTAVSVWAVMLWAGIATADATLGQQLIEAADIGNLEHVKALLRNGVNIDSRDKDGKTPLMQAARTGDLEMVKLLLEQGADVNAKYNQGGTSLTMASINNHVGVVQLLLEKGADVNVESPSKCEQGAICRWTPLMWASHRGYVDLAKLLLDHGADLNTKKGVEATKLAASRDRNRGHTAIPRGRQQ